MRKKVGFKLLAVVILAECKVRKDLYFLMHAMLEADVNVCKQTVTTHERRRLKFLEIKLLPMRRTNLQYTPEFQAKTRTKKWNSLNCSRLRCQIHDCCWCCRHRSLFNGVSKTGGPDSSTWVNLYREIQACVHTDHLFGISRKIKPIFSLPAPSSFLPPHPSAIIQSSRLWLRIPMALPDLASTATIQLCLFFPIHSIVGIG